MNRKPADPIVVMLRAERRRRWKTQRSGEWTQGWVAQRLGVAQATLCLWELGYNTPTVTKLREWANLFGFDLALLPKGATVAA